MSSMAFETRRAGPADAVAVPVTPFAEDGPVDEAALRAHGVPDAARFAAFARDAGLERFVRVAGLAEP